MDENHYVTVEEFEALVGAARKRKGGGFVRFLCEASILALAIVGGYFLLEIFVGSPAALPPPPANAQGTPYPTPYPTAPRQTGGGTTYGGSSLPSCADVTDTRTACAAGGSQAPAAVQELPTEPPAPTATPAYYAACWTVPGERPCWLPPDAPWEPPADVPATPIVAVDEGWHAPMALPADVCADWHPPAPYPEECKDGN